MAALRFRLGLPAAYSDALAPRRLRVPDLTPPTSRGRGQEHYGPTTRVNRKQGDQSGNAMGKPGPPGPGKPRPGSRFPPYPFLPPRHDRTRRTNDRARRKYQGQALTPTTGKTARTTGSAARTSPWERLSYLPQCADLTSALPGRRTAAILPGKTGAPGRYCPGWYHARARRQRDRPRRTRHRYRCSWTFASVGLLLP